MKFNEYIPAYITCNGKRLGSPADFYNKILPLLDAKGVDPLDLLCSAAEDVWYICQRPYYKVWPAIYNSLIRLNLSIPCNHLDIPKGRKGCFAIRFLTKNDDRRALLVFSIHNSILVAEAVKDAIERRPVLKIPTNINDNIEDVLQSINASEESYTNLKIALTILLLHNDPSIIEPDVLVKDIRRYERTKDEKYVKKARRHGIVGWHVGKAFEVMPHIRRPHPHLYWTGKGRKIPRIKFVKLCIVHRKKVTTVPAGYMTPEGIEIETTT